MKTHPQRPCPRPLIRTALAAAVGAALLGACQWPGGVDQPSDLRGPTRDYTVELREGTNMAASPSPDGSRIVFSAQGALWVMPAAGGRATRITDWRPEPTAPAWSRDVARIALVGDALGTVEEGKLADLIAVRGDPLTDLRAAAAVQVVIKNGRVFTQDDILGPARTPARIEARRLALAAQETLCRDEPHHCEEAGAHGH